jgi:hypothetical protein
MTTVRGQGMNSAEGMLKYRRLKRSSYLFSRKQQAYLIQDSSEAVVIFE